MFLDLGGRINAPEGYKTVDINPPADYVLDLECGDLSPLGYGQWDKIRAVDVLEHIDRKKLCALMDELWKLLKDDGELYVEVPRAGSYTSFVDPTHVSFFVEGTFDYFRPFLSYFGYVKHHWEYISVPVVEGERIKVTMKKVYDTSTSS
jgi:hypothetical protein